MRNALLLLFTILVFFFSCQCDDEIGTDVDPNPMIETSDRIDINNLEVGQMNRYISF